MPEIQLLDDEGRPALRLILTPAAARYIATADDLEPGQDLRVTTAEEPSGTHDRNTPGS